MRFTTITVSVLFVLAAALLLSCEKDTTGPGDGEFTFPHPDGAEWVYSSEDGKGSTGTKVLLNGNTQHPTGGDVQNMEIWKYDDEESQWEYNRTVYMKVTDTEVRYYKGSDDENGEVYLKFPLHVGDKRY